MRTQKQKDFGKAHRDSFLGEEEKKKNMKNNYLEQEDLAI